MYNFTLYITFIIIILFIFYKFILVYYIKEYAIIICTLFKGRSRLNSSTTHQDYFQTKNCTKFSTIWKDIKKNTCVSELKIFIKLTLVHISPFVNRMFICLIISFWVPLKKWVAQIQYLSHFFSGLDGSRTRVRNTIPCPSTSVVYYLTFPLPHDNKQPCGFSSFMIRPVAQSFANVVSHIVEAWVLKCECSRSDCCH